MDNCQAAVASCTGLSVDDLNKLGPKVQSLTNLRLSVSAGGCSDADRTIMFATKRPAGDYQFSHDVVTCGKASMGNQPSFKKCLQGKDAISDACEGCWGGSMTCGLEHCALKCMSNPYSAGCLKCGVDNCQAAIVTCTGFSQADIAKLGPTGP